MRAIGRRLAHFWIVWTMLLLVHEAGHAYIGWRQGLVVNRVTVGVGPVIWREQIGATEAVLRLVPLVGVTSTRVPRDAERARIAVTQAMTSWDAQIVRLSGGVVATLLLAVGITGIVALLEHATARRSVWGRMLIADAIVLTVFNFLPVPPLDGGRAMLVAIGALRDAPLSADTLFWLQLGGLAVAIVPMVLWTSWTARIDRVVMRWGAPTGRWRDRPEVSDLDASLAGVPTRAG